MTANRPLNDILPNTIQNIFQFFKHSIQMGCCNLESFKRNKWLMQPKMETTFGDFINMKIWTLRYQSHCFSQPKPISWNADVWLLIHEINLIAYISPIIDLLKQHTKTPAGAEKYQPPCKVSHSIFVK